MKLNESQSAYLHHCMKQAGLTQDRLAEMVGGGIDQPTLNRQINGRRAIKADVLLRLFTILRIRLDEWHFVSGGVREDTVRRLRRDEQSEFDRKQLLVHPGSSNELWVVEGDDLDLAGILPGDRVIVDVDAEHAVDDVVVLSIDHETGGSGRTVLRLYRPGFFVNHSRRGAAVPESVGDNRIHVVGVAVGFYRAARRGQPPQAA